MSVTDEAKAAAEAEYPARIHIDGVAVPDPRPPFAHGYQRGYEAAMRDQAALIERAFRAGWERSGEGYNAEHSDGGDPWLDWPGREEFLRTGRARP